MNIFHFKSEHKEFYIECGWHRNPYICPELCTANGNWQFNLSAAEQTNTWYGHFLAIVHNIQADQCKFFLDDMIKWQNRMVVMELKCKGKLPYNIPR